MSNINVTMLMDLFSEDVTTQLTNYDSTESVPTVNSPVNVSKIQWYILSMLYGILVLSALEDVTIILIIFKTKTLGLNNAFFLGLQCFIDFVIETFPLIKNVMPFGVDSRLRFFMFVVIASLSVHLLTLSTLILYIAICKATLYMKISSSWKFVISTSVVLLVLEIALQLLFVYADQSFYLEDVERGTIAFLPTYSTWNCWVGILVLLHYVTIPGGILIWSQFKIYKFRKRLSAANKHKLRLSVLICIVTVLSILTFIPQHVVRMFRLQRIGHTFSYLVYLLFNVVKLPYYLMVYPPFMKTVKSVVCCCKCSHVHQLRVNTA